MVVSKRLFEQLSPVMSQSVTRELIVIERLLFMMTQGGVPIERVGFTRSFFIDLQFRMLHKRMIPFISILAVPALFLQCIIEI